MGVRDRQAVRTPCFCNGTPAMGTEPMKTAFTLILLALLIVPAAITVRIMVWRERKRQRDEEG
jgi:hypothetical protein